MSSRIPKELRELVRQRASKRCEYCGIPEYNLYAPHHVDHIIPPLFDGTEDDTNLAWACFLCNSIKSSHIGNYNRQTKVFTPLFHPREDIWDEHFKLEESGLILGKSAIGEITANLLRMNTPNRIEQRQILIELGLWADDISPD